MAIFRKRPDRIRGIAGSLEGTTVLVVDGSAGPGPGIVRVAAESGAQVILAGPDRVSIDLQLRPLATTPGSVVAVVTSAADPTEQAELLEAAPELPDVVVVNPTMFALDPDPNGARSFLPQQAVAMAQSAATAMQDRGRTGSIVFVTEIDRQGAAASASAYLNTEMRRLAAAVAPNGIRVNAVAVGHVAVNRRGHVVANRIAPLGHSSLHPVEIGKAAWFLINDELSAGITGTTLVIDRGASLPRPEW